VQGEEVPQMHVLAKDVLALGSVAISHPEFDPGGFSPLMATIETSPPPPTMVPCDCPVSACEQPASPA
jgi:hypothetical protein